jgi:hypothetical protein
VKPGGTRIPLLPSFAWVLWQAIEIVDASTNHHVDLASANWSEVVHRREGTACEVVKQEQPFVPVAPCNVQTRIFDTVAMQRL